MIHLILLKCNQALVNRGQNWFQWQNAEHLQVHIVLMTKLLSRLVTTTGKQLTVQKQCFAELHVHLTNGVVTKQ
jgi:hypothetical protein